MDDGASTTEAANATPANAGDIQRSALCDTSVKSAWTRDAGTPLSARTQELHGAGHDADLAPELLARRIGAGLLGQRVHLEDDAVAGPEHRHGNGHVVEDRVARRRREQLAAHRVQRAVNADERPDLGFEPLEVPLVPVVEIFGPRQRRAFANQHDVAAHGADLRVGEVLHELADGVLRRNVFASEKTTTSASTLAMASLIAAIFPRRSANGQQPHARRERRGRSRSCRRTSRRRPPRRRAGPSDSRARASSPPCARSPPPRRWRQSAHTPSVQSARPTPALLAIAAHSRTTRG